MLQVGRISDKPDQRHFDYYTRRASGKKRKPLQAVTFDRIDLNQEKSSDDNTWLKDFIDAMPEDTVRERIKEYLDSSTELEDILSEKLIMEEL
ncbi:MAG: hypothetical protein ACLFQB_01330 [Chitinispirillaceae bacterium]